MIENTSSGPSVLTIQGGQSDAGRLGTVTGSKEEQELAWEEGMWGPEESDFPYCSQLASK